MAPPPFITLGGYAFHGFGIPEKINGGGAHKIVTHKMLGGSRVIDAMGADDAAIKFTGRFRGAGAMADAMLMDAMRRAGAAVQLVYSNQTATVVISKFDFSFERFYEVPYSLECEVVSAQGQAGQDDTPTLDGAVGSDINGAQAAAGSSTATQAALAPAAASYSTNGPLSSATSAQAEQVQSDVGGTMVRLGAISSPADISPGPPGGVVAGGDPNAMGASLTSQAGIMTDGAAAQNATPYMTRVNLNLQQGGGLF